MVRLRIGRSSERSESSARPVERDEHGPQSSPGEMVEAALNLTTPPPLLNRDDHDFIQAVQQRLIAEPDPPRGRLEAEPDYFQQRIRAIVADLLEQSERVVPERERLRLVQIAQADILGFGPIEPFLADDRVSEIMVNGPKQVWIEREGRLYETSISFMDDEHVRRIISRIIAPLGRRCDESSPMVDARLPDGSRVNAIIPLSA